MTWSLNEVEGLARKAARGAGMSWGMAEEAGRSARYLAGVGLPGADALADLLTMNDGVPHASLAPQDIDAPWCAPGDGVLCPLITGALICDLAAPIGAGRKVVTGRLAHPLLMVPFVAAAAEMSGQCLRMEWQGGDFSFDHEARGALGQDCAITDRVSVSRGSPSDAPLLSCRMRSMITPETAARLLDFAQRTFAPETPESRLSGAGAGLSDND